MSDANRSRYLSDDPGARVDPDHSKIIPDWLTAEASKEEDWEKPLKAQLEVEGFGREFRKKFLEGYEIENRQMVQKWKPQAAADWLSAKVKVEGQKDKIDRNKASAIMSAALCPDEQASEVLSLLVAIDKVEEPKDGGSPARQLSQVSVAPTAAETLLEDSEHRKSTLRKSKKVGSYGVIVTDASAQLWREGSMLAELNVEDCGGFAVVAGEIEALASEEDANLFFNYEVGDDDRTVRAVAWLKPKAALSPTHAAFYRAAEDVVTFLTPVASVDDTAKSINDAINSAIGIKNLHKCAHAVRGGLDFMLEMQGTEAICKSTQAALAPIFDDPAFQRNDEQQGQSGAFDPAAIQPRPEGGPGPVSLVPGAKTPLAPQLPAQPLQ